MNIIFQIRSIFWLWLYSEKDKGAIGHGPLPIKDHVSFRSLRNENSSSCHSRPVWLFQVIYILKNASCIQHNSTTQNPINFQYINRKKDSQTGLE